ncbi:MAG: sigma-70 family RNA polymerase sigma factor [bacterium]|nr:sigma-70 family RNA polymerase sigma factor [bacterium]
MPSEQSEREVFLQYYEAYKDRIYTYFWYRTGFRREVAEDCAQEVFLRALQAFASFDQDRPFAPWVFRIAHNHLVNYYRQQRPTLDLEEIPELPAPKSDMVEHRIECERVLRAMEQLDERDRNLLLLRYVDGLAHDEIAQVVGRRSVAVRVAVHRAIRRLRTVLGSDGDDVV